MSVKSKLLSCISMFVLVLGILIIGVLAASQQTLTMTGSVNFNVADKSLWVKQVRIKQDNGTDPVPVTEFLPGYINGENGFNMNIGDFTGEHSNTLGSFSLYFDIINTTTSQWAISNVTLSSELQSQGVTASYSGVISAGTLTSSDQITQDTELSGTLILTISAPNLSAGEAIDLSGITITIEEYIAPDLQVTSVFSTGATTDTYNDLTGERWLDGSIDLSNITFNSGETTLTISMTSLNENYIKNKVSWINTNGVSISSTSLYLPQNPSEEITSGESRDLKIYVNNTGSPTTISGLQVSFEEKTSLLQVDTENEYYYVEMGTMATDTGSQYLKWRYFSDGDEHYTFDSSTAPTGTGYFILEDYTNLLSVSFNNDFTKSGNYYHNLNGWTNVIANDYATSTIRRYINGEAVYKGYSVSNGITSPSGNKSDMYTDLNIDPENDAVYQNIITRSLGDLYSKNYFSTTGLDSSGNGITFPDLSNATDGYQYTVDDKDKFWLISYEEAYKLLGNSTTSADNNRGWSAYYWLRTPSGRANSTLDVGSDGLLYDFNHYTTGGRARPAFIFSIV